MKLVKITVRYIDSNTTYTDVYIKNSDVYNTALNIAYADAERGNKVTIEYGEFAPKTNP